MSIRIITGSTGTNHVTSQDDGSLNQVILGSKSVVLDIGEKLAAVVVDNNTVRISDGDLLLQGRHARIDAGTVEDMTIGTGTIEMNRNDLIVARYTLDVATGFENIELIVLEGAESTGSASDPAYNTGNIRTGSAIVDFPLYRVRIEGINIVGLVRLFEISGGVNSSLIADAYSAIKTYKAGEICISNGVMWKSLIDNNTGNEPIEGIYWTRTSIGGQVSELNQNLTDNLISVDNNFVIIKTSQIKMCLKTINIPRNTSSSIYACSVSELTNGAVNNSENIIGVIGFNASIFDNIFIGARRTSSSNSTVGLQFNKVLNDGLNVKFITYYYI